MDLRVRPATEADVPALVAIHSSQSDFDGKWFTNPFAGGKEARYEDLTPAQRWLHGGPGMDSQLLTLHLDRLHAARGVVLVAEREGAIVGSAELWPAEEPLPIGAYFDVERLITNPAASSDIERALLDGAVRESRGRDLRALDIAPSHAGGDFGRLQALGFSVLIEHRTVHRETGRRLKPPEYSVQSTAPTYTDLRGFVAMNHADSPSFRIGDLGNEWSAGLLADVSRPFGALLRVDFATLGVTGRVCPWFPEPEAELDLWIPVSALGNLPWFRRAVAAAIDHLSKHHRVARYRTTVPAHQLAALQALGFEDGADVDPWLRKHLSVRNL